MIAEALEYLAGLVTDARTPVKLEIPDPRAARYALGGRLVEVELPPPPRNHALGDLDDVIALARRFASEGDHRPVVWYDHDKVVLVANDHGHRIERATLLLEESDLFRAVRSLRAANPLESPKFKPDAFVRLLRVTLRGALSRFELLEKVEDVRFDSGIVTRAGNRRNRESWGKDIVEEVSTQVDLPDDVILMVPVFRFLDEHYPVRCQVETLPAEQSFQLIPGPDAVERARRAAVRDVGARLMAGLLPAEGDEAPGVPVYHGRP